MAKAVSQCAVALVVAALTCVGCNRAKEETPASVAPVQQHTADDGHGHAEQDSHAGHKH